MSEIPIREPAATDTFLARLGATLFGPSDGEVIPYRRSRVALTLCGCVLLGIDAVLAAAGTGGGIPVVFWGGAAACFVCSFILYMSEEKS